MFKFFANVYQAKFAIGKRFSTSFFLINYKISTSTTLGKRKYKCNIQKGHLTVHFIIPLILNDGMYKNFVHNVIPRFLKDVLLNLNGHKKDF